MGNDHIEEALDIEGGWGAFRPVEPLTGSALEGSGLRAQGPLEGDIPALRGPLGAAINGFGEDVFEGDIPALQGDPRGALRAEAMRDEWLTRAITRQQRVLKTERKLAEDRANRDIAVYQLLTRPDELGGPATVYGLAKALGVSRQAVMAMRDNGRRASQN